MLYGHLLRQQCYGVVAGPVVPRSEVGREAARVALVTLYIIIDTEPGLWLGRIRLGRAVRGLHLCDTPTDFADRSGLLGE